ncbi:ABC transporter permease [Neglectibacter caecimuris]|uniref:ABC transporter permease n=1 Tax=Neglectibacter caecimuris TaxID=3093658 RepID=UPI002AC9D695|nr:ABC transporter permease subunit [Neglectibacter sp. M00184]
MRQYKKAGRSSLRKSVWRQKTLYLMLFPAILFTVIFAYVPIWGIFTSFYDYNPGLGFSGSPFVGLKHFQRFFSEKSVFLILRNTVAISFLNILFGTVFAILFAVLLNELPFVRFKKTVQTVSYLPHFVSFVVVSNIVQTLLATNGPINGLLVSLGVLEKPVVFFTIPEAFWWLVTAMNVWKEMGWSAIIYIAAIAGIDPSLYEAAMVDGAGRLRRIWHITLTGIRPTIVVLLVLAVPDLLNAGFDASYLLGNAMVSNFSEVLDTYIFRVGLQEGQYSYAAAVGLLRQAVGLVLILSANKFSKKVSEYSLF